MLSNYVPFKVKARILDIKFYINNDESRIKELDLIDNTGIFTIKFDLEKKLQYDKLNDLIKIGEWYTFLNIKIVVKNQYLNLLYDNLSSLLKINNLNNTSQNENIINDSVELQKSIIKETINNSDSINYFSKVQIIDVIERDYIC